MGRITDLLEQGPDGWVAIFQGKRFEIKKSEADGIYQAKLLAIKHFKIPKSKQGLLAIAPAYNESTKVNLNALTDQLANNDEVSAEDLVDVAGVSKDQADKLIKAWFEMNTKERDSLGLSKSKMDAWTKKHIK